MSQKNVFCRSIILNNQNYFKRKHIHDLLGEAIHKPAVTVIANTGFGKTHAVYSFLQESDVIATWQQLTSLDNICVRFWGNLINVVALHNKKLATKMEMIGFPDTSAKVNMLVSVLIDEGAGEKRYAMVFDDFYMINETRILMLIENVINACVPNFCIILISRNEPEINLADLSVKNMVYSIGEDDLRFTQNEMERYFKMQDIHISPLTMLKIYDNTDGWIFAIRLIELAIKQGAPHEEYAIDAMKLNVFKMMESKYFSKVSSSVQKLLVKLSLFQSLPSELVGLLTHDDEQLLNEFLKINSFIRYDSFANIYIVHHLFLDFLKHKQNMLTKNERKECYRSAASWYAKNGYKIDAINYYGQAADYENVIDLALTFPYTLSEEVAILILDILDRATEGSLEKQPLLIVLRSRALLSIKRTEEALAEINIHERKYAALPRTAETRAILCEIYLIKAMISYVSCVNSNRFEFYDFVVKSYECMPLGSAVLKDKHNNHVLGAYVCRIGSEGKEDMDNYIKVVTASIPYLEKVAYGLMSGLDDLSRAELAYFKNQMKSAESFAHGALYKARKNGQYDIESRALFYLLRIALSTADYSRIIDILNQIDKQFESELPDYKMLYDVLISWFYSVIDCGEKVAGWLKSNFVKNNTCLAVSGIENLSTMKYYISYKKYYELLNFAENEENMSDIRCFLFGRIAIAVNKAVCQYHLGKQDEAIEFLQEAYELALPNSLIMHFIELGNDMVALTKYALKSEQCKIPDDWLKNILRKSSAYAKKVSMVASEYKKENQPETSQFKLTKRELEFLTDLCHGLSNAEIASNRGISKNYVNNRLPIIYSKLGAQNVKDAIHIATLMKLVK